MPDQRAGRPRSGGVPPRPSKARPRPPGRPAQRRNQRHTRRNALVAGAVVVIAAAVVVAVLLTTGPPARSAAAGPVGPEGVSLETGPVLAAAGAAGHGAPIDGVGVDAASVSYHIHVHLAVYVDGEARAIPYGIGMVGVSPQKTPHGVFANATKALYWLHTHARDGIIHVESPSTQTFYLGQFFGVWGQPLSRHQVGPARGTVTAFVDGKRWTASLATIPFREHEEIQLDVGTPVVAFRHVHIPSSL